MRCSSKREGWGVPHDISPLTRLILDLLQASPERLASADPEQMAKSKRYAGIPVERIRGYVEFQRRCG